MEASLYSIIQWSKTWNILEPEQRCLKQQRLLCSRHLARTLRRRSGSRSARLPSSWRSSSRWSSWWRWRWSYGRSAGLSLDTADLVDIILHQLGVVELEVSGKGNVQLLLELLKNDLCPTCPRHLAQKACGGSCTHPHKPVIDREIKRKYREKHMNRHHPSKTWMLADSCFLP